MTYTERARALRPYIEKAATNLTDEDALQAVELFPQWHILLAGKNRRNVKNKGEST